MPDDNADDARNETMPAETPVWLTQFSQNEKKLTRKKKCPPPFSSRFLLLKVFVSIRETILITCY